MSPPWGWVRHSPLVTGCPGTRSSCPKAWQLHGEGSHGGADQRSPCHAVTGSSLSHLMKGLYLGSTAVPASSLRAEAKPAFCPLRSQGHASPERQLGPKTVFDD